MLPVNEIVQNSAPQIEKIIYMSKKPIKIDVLNIILFQYDFE